MFTCKDASALDCLTGEPRTVSRNQFCFLFLKAAAARLAAEQTRLAADGVGAQHPTRLRPSCLPHGLCVAPVCWLHNGQ